MDAQRAGISRRGFLKAFGAGLFGLGLGGALTVKYALEVEPRWPRIEQVDVPLAGLAPGLDRTRVVCLSDFHLHPYTRIELVQECVRLVNRLEADLVCLLGDYVFDRADAILELAPVLVGIRARTGTYAVLGNHDLWTDPALIAATLEEQRIPVLSNAHRVLDLPGGRLVLAGLDDGWSGIPDLEQALAGAPQATTLLMLHEPDLAEQYQDSGRVQLQLSGHSHGGQVRLPGFGAPFLPRYAQKYDQGLYDLGAMRLYTTRGIGVIGPPLRFNCRPEISLLTLRCA